MSAELPILLITVAAIGVGHTLLGPDHYLPFVCMGTAERWSRRKTLCITALCGVGHVLATLVIASVGVALASATREFMLPQALRGSGAAWGLIAFGLVYAVWGLRRSSRRRTHAHAHRHSNGTVHHHSHAHTREHTHAHTQTAQTTLTPWILFVVFIFGPCEALIPIIMVTWEKMGFLAIICVCAIFALSTIGSMLSMVTLALVGARYVPISLRGEYSHSLSGVAVGLCGLAMLILDV